MSIGRLLIIDDERHIRHLIKNEFSEEGFRVSTAATGEEGIKMARQQQFDVILLDIKLPRMNGIQTLRKLKQEIPLAKVIMITGYGDIKTAIESMKLGAIDYITKPFKLKELLAISRAALQTPYKDLFPISKGRDSNGKGGVWQFVTCPSWKMREVYMLARKVAPTPATVLLCGETGVGKDVLACQIHQWSNFQNGPFVTVDCGLLTNELAESEFYGHRKGAFSGAIESKAGLIENAENGTLFLDEVGNISLELQKKFLRFLETKKFRRVGELTERQIDARIILATNLDIGKAVKAGKFRSDLLYRISSFTINIPPLRERPDDIIPLAKHFLRLATPGNRIPSISPEAQNILRNYYWPGNIRELRSVITTALILSEGQTIKRQHLPSTLLQAKTKQDQGLKTLEEVEKNHILAVLEKTGGNQTQASAILGVNRKTLYRKIKKYKIFD